MKKYFESGRSMVEMLGTLAIIGVLSVGGIAGYSYGMDKYRANQTINDVNLRGIDLVRQVAMGQTLSLSEWSTTSKAGYTIGDPILSAEGDAYFTISGIPQRVCELVYKGIQNNQTTQVDVNGVLAKDASACNKKEDNKMGFFFITNAGEGGTNPEDLCKNITCPEGNSCTHGICMSEERPMLFSGINMSCETDGQCSECKYCSNRFCAPKTNGTICNGGTCQDGNCIFNDNTCATHNDCALGYFCDSGNSNLCVKLEFYNTSISGIYVSKHANSLPDLCERSGFYPPSKEQFLEIGPKFGNDILSTASIYTKDSGFCDWSGRCTYKEGFALCAQKENNWEYELEEEDKTQIILPEATTITVTEMTTTEQVCNCGTNQYCADTNEDTCASHPSGQCKDLDFREVYIDGTTYYISKDLMSWWDAEATCAALSKKFNTNLSMITMSELVTNTDGSNWTSGSGIKTRKILAQQLYNALQDRGGFWTIDANGSCFAYYITLDDGYVDGSYARDYWNLAICR